VRLFEPAQLIPPADIDDVLTDVAVGMTCAHLAAQADCGSPLRARYLATAEAVLTSVHYRRRCLTGPTEDVVALKSAWYELATLVAALRR
jgi:hypothetical protein